MIDYDALDAVEDACRGVRAVMDTGLSERYVPGEGGAPEAFIIGEAPGAHEDMQLRPFVGPAGNVMRQLMALANLSADNERPIPLNCWLTNVLKFRPPKNRAPLPNEISAFRHSLLDEWKAVGSPSLIIPVGGAALHAVVGKRISILRAAGKCHMYTSKGRELAIWPMVHPSFGLRVPAVQSLLEQDWERLSEWRSKH